MKNYLYADIENKWWVFNSSDKNKAKAFLKSIGIIRNFTLREASGAEVDTYRSLYKNLIFDIPTIPPASSGSNFGAIVIGSQFKTTNDMFVGNVNLQISKGTILEVVEIDTSNPIQTIYKCVFNNNIFKLNVAAFNGMQRIK